MRVEVAGDGVKVVLVEPGGFKTGIWEEFQRNIDQREADGTRHGSAYRRSLQGQRMMEPIMGRPAGLRQGDRRRALTARCPASRYLVGLDAQAILLAERLTPTFVKDRVLRHRSRSVTSSVCARSVAASRVDPAIFTETIDRGVEQKHGGSRPVTAGAVGGPWPR